MVAFVRVQTLHQPWHQVPSLPSLAEPQELQVDSAAPKSAESNTDDSSNSTEADKPKSADDKKKAAVAAAIARAKAKKLQKEGNNQS